MARLVSAADEIGTVWSDEDLAAIFAHQLRTTLVFVAREAGSVDDVTVMHDPACTVGQMLCPETPSLEALVLVKDYCKAIRAGRGGFLPQPVATALYYLAIATAWCRCGKRISRLTRDQLIAGLAWIEEQPWTPQRVRHASHELAATLPEAR
jgi:hypothetical protein